MYFLIAEWQNLVKEDMELGKSKMKLFIITLVAIVLTFMSQASYAYYTTAGKATNVVTSGNLRLLIHETTDQGNPFPPEGVYIMPGDVVSKKVTVENNCAHPFYLRVKVVYGINSQVLPVEDCFKLDMNDTDWVFHDGWYYYKNIVAPGETTPAVFSHVEIVGSKVDNSYIGKTLTLTVEAQAVQSENNPLTDNLIYTVSGWPK